MTDDQSRQALIAEIAAVATLHGQFKLRSGTMSSTYFDKYLFETQPLILRPLSMRMEKLPPAGAEALAGLELGGIPLATAISLHTGTPCVLSGRKQRTMELGRPSKAPPSRANE